MPDQHMLRLRRALGRRPVLAAALSAAIAAAPAEATFHFMHIQQIAASVNGDPTAQAVMLRMRSNGQNLVSNGKLVAFDAHGENPILLIDFTSDVHNAIAGDHVLVATARFALYTQPAAEPDFILRRPIPEDYLRAGSIIFETDAETLIVCRLSWGGANYTGSTLGAQTNDDDGDFGPPFPGPLPDSGFGAVAIQIGIDQATSTNADDYAVVPEPAVFLNNARQSFTLAPFHCPSGTADADGDLICSDLDNCPNDANFDQLDSDADGAGDACDACPHDPSHTSDASACAGGGTDTNGEVPDDASSNGDGGTDSNGDFDDDPRDGPAYDGGGYYPPPGGDSNGASDDHDHEGNGSDHDDTQPTPPPAVTTGCGAGTATALPATLLLGLVAGSRPRRIQSAAGNDGSTALENADPKSRSTCVPGAGAVELHQVVHAPGGQPR